MVTIPIGGGEFRLRPREAAAASGSTNSPSGDTGTASEGWRSDRIDFFFHGA